MRWELSLDRELVREVFVIRISSRSSLCTSRITNTQDIPTDPRSRKEEATQRERFSLRGRNVFLIGDSQIAQLSESPDAASGAVRNFRHVPGATVGRSGRRGLLAALASKSLRIRAFRRDPARIVVVERVLARGPAPPETLERRARASCFVISRPHFETAPERDLAPLRLGLVFSGTALPGETSEDGPIPKTTCDAIVASVGARVVACVLLGGEQDTYALRPAHPDWNDSLMSPDVNLASEHNPKRKAH